MIKITVKYVSQSLLNGPYVVLVDDDDSLFAAGNSITNALGFLFCRQPEMIADGFTCEPDPDQPGHDQYKVVSLKKPSLHASGRGRIDAIGNFVLMFAEFLGIQIAQDKSLATGALPENLADDIPTHPEKIHQPLARRFHVIRGDRP